MDYCNLNRNKGIGLILERLPLIGRRTRATNWEEDLVQYSEEAYQAGLS